MHVKNSYFCFENIITSKFLFYAWVDLKTNKNYLYINKHKNFLRKSWFKKASILISKSKFIYHRNFNLTSLSFIKNKIIENAILIFINSFFKISHSNINFSLTECVRELIQYNFCIKN